MTRLIFIVYLAAMFLSGCGTQTGDKSVTASAQITRLEIKKSKRKLYAYSGNKLIYTFSIKLGGNLGVHASGPKACEGDKKTPEGEYTVKKTGANKFKFGMYISYPNSADRAAAKSKGCSPGGEIMIHSDYKEGRKPSWFSSWMYNFDWTSGCIYLKPALAKKLWDSSKYTMKIKISA